MSLSQLGWTIFAVISSIPEEAFIIYFGLFLFGRHEQIKLRPNNTYRLLISASIAAAPSVLLRTYVPVVNDTGLIMVIGVVLMWLVTVVAYNITGIKNLLKAFICTTLGFILVMLFQVSYVPFLLAGTRTGLEEINKLGINSFIWSLPEIAMIVCAFAVLTVKKNMYKKVGFLMVLTRNKVVMTITIVLTIFNITFLGVMAELICFNKILWSIAFIYQLLIIVITVIFPISNITLLFVALYSIYYRDTISVMLSKDRINTLVSILAVYAEEKNYSKIDNLVEDLHRQVNYL